MAKLALVIFADTETHEGLARTVNALETAIEAKENNDIVKIVFDEAGTKWIPELANKDHKAHLLFDRVKDKVSGACEFCAGAFGVQDKISELNFPLINEYYKHPSLRSDVADGYSVITF